MFLANCKGPGCHFSTRSSDRSTSTITIDVDKLKDSSYPAQTSHNAAMMQPNATVVQRDQEEEGFWDHVRRWMTPSGATQERAQKVFEPAQQAAQGAWDQLVNNRIKYKYEDLAARTGNFSAENRLGAGAAGAVYKGTSQGQNPVAVKVLKDMGGFEGFEEEVRVLSNSELRHPNLVTLYGFASHEGTKYLVYELLVGGDLHGKLQKSKMSKEPYLWPARLQCALHVAKGLFHMMPNARSGRPKTFHRDIKSPNILIEEDGTAKMADFGLAGIVPEGQNHIRVKSKSGTPGYCCPSYMQTGVVSEKSEVFSYGMVLFELLLNVPPALAGNEGELVFPILQQIMPAAPGAHGRVLSSLDPTAGWQRPLADDFADLALQCIDMVPERRPLFEDIVKCLELMSKNASSRTHDDKNSSGHGHGGGWWGGR